jgi:molybdate transport system substrate-binding protein
VPLIRLTRVAGGRAPSVGALLLALCMALPACSGGEGGEGVPRSGPDTSLPEFPLLVFAASDLVPVLEAWIPLEAARTGTRITLVPGSTGSLAAQIEQGAPADLFFAANRPFMDRLAEAERLIADTRGDYARGRLALIWGEGVAPPEGLEELPARLASNPGDIVALANPEHAPYGTAAAEVLQALGWPPSEAAAGLLSQTVFAGSVSQVVQLVDSGNAEFGFIAVSLLGLEPPRPHWLVPEALHTPLLQQAAVIRGTPREARARDFLARLLSPEGQAHLALYGFEPPQVEGP